MLFIHLQYQVNRWIFRPSMNKSNQMRICLTSGCVFQSCGRYKFSGRQTRITIRNAAFGWSRNANVKMQPRENRCGHCV